MICNVLQKHIDKANHDRANSESGYTCPVDQAIQDAIGNGVISMWAHESGYISNSTDHIIATTKADDVDADRVRNFVDSWDGEFSVQPFSFNLSVTWLKKE